MLNVILIRHGDAPKKDKIIFGMNFGRSLTKKGRRQVNSLVNKLKKIKIDEFITSDMKRALQTSEIISKKIEKKFTINKQLREIDPRIENNENLIKRCKIFLKNIQEKRGTILLSSHGTFNKTFLTISAVKKRKEGADYFNSLEQDNACLNLLNYNRGRWRIEKINDITHLKNEI